MRICVIDDSAIDRAIALTALAQLDDAQLSESAGGREIMDDVERARPDLIIVDWTMPAMTGAIFIKKYRDAGGAARIIVMAHETERQQMAEAFRAGANHYVLKPVTPKTLLRCVHQVMSR